MTPPRRGSSIRVRRWKESDIPAIVECQRAAYPDYPEAGQYDERIYELQFQAFPEGQCLAELDGQVVGYATSLIVQLDGLPHLYEYDELTGSGTFSTHDPGGNSLYGADIAVRPDMRGQGVAGQLYKYRTKLMRKYNLRRMVAYGRLTGYPEYAGRLTAEEYVREVEEGRLKDRALSAHLKAGYRVRQVSLEIMRDEPSRNWATLLELENPDYDPKKRRIAAAPLTRPVRKIRVCAAQYYMRRLDSYDEFAATIRFFAEVADEYHGHFLVLPELVTAVLLRTAPPDTPAEEAMRYVATWTERYVELLVELAAEFNLYIVGGSTPVVRDGSLYNVCHVVAPSGAVGTQDKLHVTPTEREVWGFRPGEGLRIFDTPFGRIAVAICYDVEFPEIGRILALGGADVLFVPFSTDEQKAYHRVRITAAARAVENAIYVVIAGNAGSMPSRNYLLNYARSAVLCPSDFGFPDRAVIAEADPNVETVVVADLDLTSLAQYRLDGSVRPLRDQRVDIYETRAKQPIDIVTLE